MTTRPVIAISSCIMGQPVRYDGEIKHYPELCQHLQTYFECLPVCPETEIGLSVPRPAVQLSGDPAQPRMTGRDDPSIDISDLMRNYCKTKIVSLTHISAYVFKSRSPSCGPNNIPVFNNHQIIADNNRGLFAETVISTYPDLPVADEITLTHQAERDIFIQQVLDYYAKQTL
ncbi:MAG: DUF523 domain-containing protein [Gammaproteobacteria bacterium]|nr:DUF523 domain-containing protein [Gammaproteobacteria bacterium]MCW9004221.1 DUF523 domain-containing protein [Gammaproteobacteria bacterium]MCW9055459.1 DUF523 domain-containing protein [Gammaproteobacteria bacterium]